MHDDKQLLVLTAMGADRPGIVAQVTEFLNAHALNVEDARMAVLGGEFALMMLVSGTAQATASIQDEVAKLEQQTDLAIRLKPTRRATPAAGMPYVVRAYCMDREGVVHAIASVLARRGVNITSLESAAYPAPFSGTNLFRMTLRMHVPHELMVRQLRSDLELVAAAENIDVTLEPERG